MKENLDGMAHWDPNIYHIKKWLNLAGHTKISSTFIQGVKPTTQLKEQRTDYDFSSLWH